MKTLFNFLLLTTLSIFTVTSANAMVIIGDNFDMDNDWSGNTVASLKGITSTHPGGNKWGSIGVNHPAVINQESRHGDNGRGLRFELNPGTGAAAIGCEMAGYPQEPWRGRSQFIGYYSKISDNSNWGTKGNTLKMLRFNMEKNDVIPELVNGEYSIFIGTYNVFNGIYKPDNNWHKYLWEFTAQSSPGAADGTIRLWVDDNLVWENTGVKWNSYGTIKNGTQFEYGLTNTWYYFFIQGNLMASYNGPKKHMYWDDFMIATSKLEVENFINASGLPKAKNQATGGEVASAAVPTEVTDVTARASAADQIELSWTTNVEDTGIIGYKVYRNGAFLTNVTGTSMTDTDLQASTEYTYTVHPTDKDGNMLPQSVSATATTDYASAS